MKLRGDEPDPVAIAGSWDEHHENRIQALQAKYQAVAEEHAKAQEHNSAQAHAQLESERSERREKASVIPAEMLVAAKSLGVEVIAFRRVGAKVSVRCPRCGGERPSTSYRLLVWMALGAVPECGRGRHATCKPNTEVASDDAEDD